MEDIIPRIFYNTVVLTKDSEINEKIHAHKITYT
jgi:hypothetical protein